MKKRKTLPAVERAFEIIRFLALHPEGCSFAEISGSFEDLSPSTLSRLIKALLNSGQIAKSEGSNLYKIGPAFVSIVKIIQNSSQRWEIIKPFLDDLAQKTKESAAYCEFEKGMLVLRAKTEYQESFHYQPVFSKTPRVWENGFGLVCLAYHDSKLIENILQQATISLGISRSMFCEKLKMIKEKRFLICKNDSTTGITRFIAPVFCNKENNFAGSIGITALTRKFSKEEISKYREAVISTSKKATLYLKQLEG